MQLREYGTVLVRRWWLFVLIAVVAAGSAFFYSKLQRPIYKSTVFITVEGSRADYGLTLAGGGGLRLFARRMQSEEFAKEVNRRLNLDLSTEMLKGMTRVSAIALPRARTLRPEVVAAPAILVLGFALRLAGRKLLTKASGLEVVMDTTGVDLVQLAGHRGRLAGDVAVDPVTAEVVRGAMETVCW